MRKTPFVVFGVFLTLSVVLVFTRSTSASQSLQSFLQSVFSYPRDVVTSILPKEPSQSEIEKLRSENRALLSEKYDIEQLRRENEVLRSQFRDSGEDASDLLPVRVLGRIGDYSHPEVLIVSSAPDVQLGDTVVLGNNLVGIVTNISGGQARVETVYNDDFELVGRSVMGNSGGVVRGGEGEIYFEEVSVDDMLTRGDMLVSEGAFSEGEELVPQGLVVGKIMSVKDEAQAPFKSAVVESLVEFSNLMEVFVYVQ